MSGWEAVGAAALVSQVAFPHARGLRAVVFIAALGAATASCGSDTTRCADGSTSRSTSSGACSHHGGIARDTGSSPFGYVLVAGGVGAAFGFWLRMRFKRWRALLSSSTASETAELRKLIQSVVRSDSDLDAFCLDYFQEEVYDAFAGGMERSQKITILLRNADHAQIRKRLRERWPG